MVPDHRRRWTANLPVDAHSARVGLGPSPGLCGEFEAAVGEIPGLVESLRTMDQPDDLLQPWVQTLSSQLAMKLATHILAVHPSPA